MNTQQAHSENVFNRIYRRIQWDIRVNNSDILFSVENGHVILNGYFDKPYRHSAAVEIIKSTEGVESLEDLSMVVADYFRTDVELRSLIERQIRAFQLVKGEWIRVSVADGVAKLEGLVLRPRLKAFAASDSWGLSGIKDCINLIEVKSSPPAMLELVRHETEGLINKIRVAISPPFSEPWVMGSHIKSASI